VGAVEPAAALRKVFVVEDSPTVRRRLIELLGEVEGMRIVGEAEAPTEAIAGIFRLLPHCVVLDFRLAGGTALEVLRTVRRVLPDISFIVLTNDPSAQYRRACMEAGAMAFLDKSADLGELKRRIAECVLTQADVAGHDG
jgi:DNA-binding NarL/FixJ family response regulator